MAIGIVLATVACSRPRRDAVNEVIGDASWTLPRPPQDDVERITTHLRYVIDRLEQRAPEPPEPRARREHALALLRAYATRGVFPDLDGPTQRRMPRFIDPQGRLCAVGFLIAATDGLAVARDIGARYEYSYIDEIDDPRLDAWAARNGFSRTELAMIQPTYRDRPTCNEWGYRDDYSGECPADVIRSHPLLVSFGVGGGMSRADGQPLSYFLWGVDARFSLTPWLAIGVADMAVRLGRDAIDDNYAAFVATPLLELSRWRTPSYQRIGTQWHLDLGVSLEHVTRTDARPSTNPAAAEVALGYRWWAPDVLEFDIMLGAMVALTNDYVIDDRVSRGAVMPFLRFALGWRPF
jgi:hypothetical protein